MKKKIIKSYEKMEVEIFAVGKGKPHIRKYRKLKHGGGKDHNSSNS